jgi:hypothetical protein
VPLNPIHFGPSIGDEFLVHLKASAGLAARAPVELGVGGGFSFGN